MLVFGPYRSIPKDESFTVFNLSSMTQAIPRLPGLVVFPNTDAMSGEEEYNFDLWYYNYILNDPTACSSLMAILESLYQGNNVYVCISEYQTDEFMSILNESFMKILQTRYDIKYSIINDPDDFLYIQKDGCDFGSVDGIYNFDTDRNRFREVSIENSLASGGSIYDFI